MIETTEIALVVVAYLVGAIPFGIIVAKLWGGADPRSGGSGNIGATNVGRTLGKGAGITTLICDILKGALPTYYAVYYYPGNIDVISLVALATVLGHLFPVYLKFKGGKGVATACGVLGALSLPALLICAGAFLLIVLVSKYVSLGSMYAAITMPLALALLPGTLSYVPVSILIAMLVVYKHKENIKRLREGTENKIGKKKG